MNKLFQIGKEIIHILQQHGFEAYFVGGAVRDYLLCEPIHDVDITTSAFVQDIIDLFPEVIPVGIQHGTVIIRHQGESFEVTTYRKSSKTNEPLSLNSDLLSRDFTMNAIAMTKEFELIDDVQGQQHITQRKIQAVGNPHDRIIEDPLRILRAFRFVSIYGFQIEDGTMEAIKQQAHLLQHVAIERMLIEWKKCFKDNLCNMLFDYL